MYRTMAPRDPAHALCSQNKYICSKPQVFMQIPYMFSPHKEQILVLGAINN
jgi:hypothetical protein